MSSFTIYDPKLHSFRVMDTADSIDLPFDQVLLLNILLELRVMSEYLSVMEQDPAAEEPREVRANLVSEAVN